MGEYGPGAGKINEQFHNPNKSCDILAIQLLIGSNHDKQV